MTEIPETDSKMQSVHLTAPVPSEDFTTRESLRERCDMFVRCLPQAPMRDRLARLFEELLADQWRPIESAPKDGRWIVGIGHLWLPEVPDTLQWRDEWRGGAWSNGCSEEDHQPTHWMPLPAAPHHRSADTEEPSLRCHADALLQAGHAFWEACKRDGGGGAVRWLQADDGTTIIFTRGEYRERLMGAIASNYSAPVTVFHDEGDDERPAMVAGEAAQDERSAAPTGAVGAPGSDKPEPESDSSFAAQGMAQDAARYRWLRDRAHSLETRQRDIGAVNGPSCYHLVEGISELKWGESLDVAVDAAMDALRAVPHQPTGGQE